MDHSKKNKSARRRSLLRLFPFLDDPSKADQLKIDPDSMHYISLREDAENISLIIVNHLNKLNLDPKNTIITDATSGVGGNTISFAMSFKWVYGIEMDPLRCNYLKNNLSVYNLKNHTIINDDCLNIMHQIPDHDVIFMDPPWGGKGYKEYQALKLQLSNTSLEMICNDIMDEKFMVKSPKMIVLKLPSNYDVRYLYKMVKSDEIYFYELDKMFIFVIVNSNKKHED